MQRTTAARAAVVHLAFGNAATPVIAWEVGYSSAFAFSAAFSGANGMSPTGYPWSPTAARHPLGK